MKVPSANDPRWAKLLLQGGQQSFEFLALNMVFTRVVIAAKRDTSKENLSKLTQELREVFEKNAHNAKVVKDLERIFSAGGN